MFARTKRLFLRPGWREDAAPLAAAIGERAVSERLARVPYPYTLRDAEAYLDSPDDAWPRLLIFLMEGDRAELVGGIGLDTADGAEDAVELGYWIARPHWGKGIATEAGQAMLHIADEALRLPRLIAGHFRDNPASGRVLAKLGFQPTGRVSGRYSTARDAIVPCLDFARDMPGRAPEALAA